MEKFNVKFGVKNNGIHNVEFSSNTQNDVVNNAKVHIEYYIKAELKIENGALYNILSIEPK